MSDRAIDIAEPIAVPDLEYAPFREILEGLGDVVFVKGLDGRYISVNHAFVSLTGLAKEEIIGRSDHELFTEEVAHEAGFRDKLVQQSASPVDYDLQYLKEGRTHFLRIRKSLLRNERGVPTAIIGIARDVTAEKLAESKYRFLFDNAPIAFWEEDFSDVKAIFDELRESGVTDFRSHFIGNSDDLLRCIRAIRIRDINLATMRMNRVDNKPRFIAELRRNFTSESEGVFLDEFVALAEGRTFFQSEASTIDVGDDRLEVLFNLNVLPGHERDLSLVLVSVIDVTPLKRTESELSRLKELYRSVVEGQQEMICRFVPMGRITFLNSAFGEFFSHRLGHTLNVSFMELFPGRDHSHCAARLDELNARRPMCSFETHNYSSKGQLVWQHWSVTALLNDAGTVTEYQAVGTDITARKETEEALASSEARWRSVFESAQDLIITVNATGLILSANKGASEASGVQLAGKDMTEVLNEGNVARAREILRYVFDNRERFEMELKATAGPWSGRVLHCVITPVLFGDKVLSATVIARDVTATRRMENRVREALIDGQENERKRVARELHDGLGQLFTAIRLNLEHLRGLEGSVPADELHGRLQVLDRSVGRAISEVKHISHGLMPDLLEQFGLEAAMRDLVDNLGAGRPGNFSLEVVDLRKGLPAQVSLPLYRIAQELLTNAVRHSGAANIFVQLIDHGDSILLMVEDDGRGFDTGADSTGFGLRNIRSRAELLDGTVDIDSTPGNGTVTTIEIPIKSKLP